MRNMFSGYHVFMKNILIVNDDGIEAEGLLRLAGCFFAPKRL